MPFKRFLVGFDIGGKELKVVILRRHRAGVEMVGFDRVQLKSGSDDERSYEAGEELRRIISLHGVSNAVGCACVPMKACVLRRLSLPPVKGRNILEQLLQTEAQNQIPIPMSKMAFSYLIQASGSTEMQVLIGLCKREVVEFVLRVAHLAGLNLRLIMPSALACWNAVSNSLLSERLTCLLDIGETAVDIVVGCGEEVFVVRSIPMGIEQLTNAVAEDVGCSREEAELRLRRDGINLSMLDQLGEDSFEASGVLSWLLKFEGELVKTAQVVKQSIGEEIRKVLLCGDGAVLPNMSEWLGKRLGINVLHLDASRVAVWTKGLVSQSELLPLVGAIGVARTLAMGIPSINFMPSRKEGFFVVPRLVRYATPVLLALNIVLIAVGVQCNLRLTELRDEAEKLTMAVEEKRKQFHLESVSNDIPVMVSKMKEVVLEFGDIRGDWLELLYKLSVVLPKDAWLSEIECRRGGEVVIRGVAPSYRVLDEVVNAVRNVKADEDGKVPLFSEVVVTGAIGRQVAGRTLIDFRLMCSFRQTQRR
jgi:type IV pilus assembly protein PilM